MCAQNSGIKAEKTRTQKLDEWDQVLSKVEDKLMDTLVLIGKIRRGIFEEITLEEKIELEAIENNELNPGL